MPLSETLNGGTVCGKPARTDLWGCGEVTNRSTRKNNWISSWKVYEKDNEQIINNLPTVPNEFLGQSPILSNQLSNPENCVVNVYRITDEMELEDRYHMTGIDRQLKCIEYSNRFIGEEF